MPKQSGLIAVVLVLLLMGAGTVSAANLVSNGGFETPVISGLSATFYTGTKLTCWTIQSGSIDLLHSYWQPHAGGQSIDLAGYSPAKINQTLHTDPGATYDISFWMAGNPDVQGPKVMGVFWDGTELSPLITFDSTGKTRQNMGWTFIIIRSLTATNATTDLAFLQKSPASAYGTALDDICVISPRPVVAFPDAPDLPNDIDCDGIYEDLNANGRLDFADIVLYFNEMDWIAANEPIAAFDLNGNNRIDFADIVALFNEI